MFVGQLGFVFLLLSTVKRRLLPHLGQSDQLSLLLIPADTPLRKQTPPSTIKTFPDDAFPRLQDYFHFTDWSLDLHSVCPFLQ